MACCTTRQVLIAVLVLQLISTVQRQVFDFLGYMWAPIIGNFLQIIFIIVGLFGAIQFRPKVVIVYVAWCLIWLGWNIFVICFYLEVGVLNRNLPILNLGTGNKSWWLDNGIGCQVTNSTWTTTSPSSSSRAIPPENLVQGCILQYYYVESIQAGVQCILALAGFCLGCIVIFVFTEEDDSSQPVSDVLEYIHMRYKSPARSSFRSDGRFYETMTMQSKKRAGKGPEAQTNTSTSSEFPSDQRSDKYLAQKYLAKPTNQGPPMEAEPPNVDMPWVRISPLSPYPPQTQLDHPPFNIEQSQRTPESYYNIMEQPPGATII